MSNKKILLRAALSIFLLFVIHSTLQAQEAVDPQSGRLSVSVTDLVVGAGPVNIEVRRTLQTDKKEAGLLGSRWRLNVETRLIKEKIGSGSKQNEGRSFLLRKETIRNTRMTWSEGYAWRQAARRFG